MCWFFGGFKWKHLNAISFWELWAGQSIYGIILVLFKEEIASHFYCETFCFSPQKHLNSFLLPSIIFSHFLFFILLIFIFWSFLWLLSFHSIISNTWALRWFTSTERCHFMQNHIYQREEQLRTLTFCLTCSCWKDFKTLEF